MYFQFTSCVYGDHNIKENEIKLSNNSRAKSSAAFWRKKNHFKSFGISTYYTEQKKMIKASPHGNVNCNLFRCKGGTTAKIANLSKMNRKINDICIRENSLVLPSFYSERMSWGRGWPWKGRDEFQTQFHFSFCLIVILMSIDMTFNFSYFISYSFSL